MAFDEVLAGRIRDVFFHNRAIVSKKMFGGLAFMLHGNLCVGVIRDSLVLRIDREKYDEFLTRPHVSEFDFTGRPMRGLIVVEPEGIEDDDELSEWIQKAVTFVETLPKK